MHKPPVIEEIHPAMALITSSLCPIFSGILEYMKYGSIVKNTPVTRSALNSIFFPLGVSMLLLFLKKLEKQMIRVLLCGMIILGILSAKSWSGIEATYVKVTKRYKSVPHVREDLLSLDIYYPSHRPEKPMPVLIYVHGGAWFAGDKSMNIGKKVRLCSKLGFILVSVNYRLTTKPRGRFLDPHRILYPVYEEDVADAVRWVRRNIVKFGGDPDRIVLMGHSAGAHIVSLLGVSDRFLKERMWYLKGVVSLDGYYNVLERVRRGSLLYLNAFGDETRKLIEASPIYQVDGSWCPAFFIVTRGRRRRVLDAVKFAERLRRRGAIRNPPLGFSEIEPLFPQNPGSAPVIGSSTMCQV